jgi:hypothetical protein
MLFGFPLTVEEVPDHHEYFQEVSTVYTTGKLEVLTLCSLIIS